MNYNKWKDAKWLPYTIAACSGVLFYFILQHLNLVGNFFSGFWTVIKPLVVSIVLAYLMDPIVMIFERKVCARFLKPWHQDARRKVAIGMTVLSLILIVILFLLALIPQLIASVLYLFENFSESILSLEMQISSFTNSLGTNGIDLTSFNTAIVKALESLSGMIGNIDFVNGSQAFGSSMSTFVVGFILAIYLLNAKKTLVHTLTSFLNRLLSDDLYSELAAFCGRCHRILINYLWCTILEAIVVGCVNAVFMLLFRLPYVGVVSVIVGVTNLAPTFGPIVGCVLGMFVLLLAKPVYALYFLIFTLILQTIDGYIIKPRLFGNSLGVSPLLILISIIIGGQLFGVIGILFAIPFSAIAGYAVTEYIFPYTRDITQESAELKNEAAASHMNSQVERPRENIFFDLEEQSEESESSEDLSQSNSGAKPIRTAPDIPSAFTRTADDFFESVNIRRRKRRRNEDTRENKREVKSEVKPEETNE